MKNIKTISLSDIKTRWKTVLAIAVVSIASFSIGGFANPVIIQGVASLGGSSAPIPAPNLQILGTGFVSDPAGNVTSVNLNVTTVGSSSALTSYHVIVKIFCMPPAGAVLQCSSGNADAILPSNMTPTGAAEGASTLINVPLNIPVDPSALAQPDNMSVTTQAIPTPPGILTHAGGCTAGFSLGTALPAVDPNLAPIPPIALKYDTKVKFSATVGFSGFLLYLKTTSLCGLAGAETFTTSVFPLPTPGFGITISSAPTLLSGATNIGFETIDVPDGLALGQYAITVTACIGITCHSVTQTVDVVPQPPF